MELWKNISGSIYGSNSDNQLPPDLKSRISASKKLTTELEVAYRNLKAYVDAMKLLAETTMPVANDMMQLANVGGEKLAGPVVKAAEAISNAINRSIVQSLNSNMAAIDIWRKSLIDLDIKLEEQKKMEIELYALRGRMIRAGTVNARRDFQQQIDIAESKRDGIASIIALSFKDLVSDSGNRGGQILMNFASAQQDLAEKGLCLALTATDVCSVIGSNEGKTSKDDEEKDQKMLASISDKSHKRDKRKSKKKKKKNAQIPDEKPIDDNNSRNSSKSGLKGSKQDHTTPPGLLDLDTIFHGAEDVNSIVEPNFFAFDPLGEELQAKRNCRSQPGDASATHVPASQTTQNCVQSKSNVFADLDPFNSRQQ